MSVEDIKRKMTQDLNLGKYHNTAEMFGLYKPLLVKYIGLLPALHASNSVGFMTMCLPEDRGVLWVESGQKICRE